MENKEIIIKESLKPISLPKHKEITRQTEKCVCKIHISGNNGTGFFAKIPYQDNLITVLITNNHVLKANDILEKKTITFSINNIVKDIKIDKERITYTSEKYDTTIIEIREELDNLAGVIEFLEIDDNISEYIKEKGKYISDEHFNNLYSNESLYVLNYLGGKEIVISYGFFAKLVESKIYHKCSTDYGSSGSPILSLENNKLLGVHYGNSNHFSYNTGTLIAYPIIEFQNIKAKNGPIKKPFNSMIIKYKIDNDNRAYNKLRLFGDEFVKNNKDKCIIIIGDKTQELTSHINIDEKMRSEGFKEIKLKEIQIITNMSHMFCRGIEEEDRMLLISIPDIFNWDTSNVIDMSYLFCGCEYLESLPAISSWNTSKVKDFSNMISYCGNLKTLSDISNWDTSNVTNMSHMFANDWKLKEFPDISKWNTSKVEDMEHMFTRCLAIKEMPNISKWDVKNVINMSYMFSYCKNLEFIPDISVWKIKSANYLRGMFYRCYCINNLPNISNWEINKNEQLFYIFTNCHHSANYNSEIKKVFKKYGIGEQYLNNYTHTHGGYFFIND